MLAFQYPNEDLLLREREVGGEMESWDRTIYTRKVKDTMSHPILSRRNKTINLLADVDAAKHQYLEELYF